LPGPAPRRSTSLALHSVTSRRARRRSCCPISPILCSLFFTAGPCGVGVAPIVDLVDSLCKAYARTIPPGRGRGQYRRRQRLPLRPRALLAHNGRRKVGGAPPTSAQLAAEL